MNEELQSTPQIQSNQNVNEKAQDELQAAKVNELTQFEKSVTELHDLLGLNKLNSSPTYP